MSTVLCVSAEEWHGGAERWNGCHSSYEQHHDWISCCQGIFFLVS